jgi:hypothetical protein
MTTFPYPGAQRAGPIAVEEAEALLRALMALGPRTAATSSSIRCCRPRLASSGISYPAVLPSSSGARSTAASGYRVR